MNDVKYSYNSYTMNRPSQILGIEAVKDDEYFRETLEKIITTREHAKKKLESLGFEVTDSRANFLFASHPDYPAEELFAMLKESGIYVRYFKAPRIDNYLRITVGTDEQMEALYRCLEDIMK